MSTSSDPISTPIKAKRKLDLPNSKTQSPLLSSKTPDKPTQQPPRRTRNRGVALSIEEVRNAARNLRESSKEEPRRPSDRIKSARKQILLQESLVRKSENVADVAVKLPEKYQILGDFFDSLHSSIRLLRLKGTKPTFTNICPKIECLTDRRFSYNHLAQMKFILPEAIEIKKLLVFDERTSCMKPDLHVSLDADAIETNGKPETGTMHLRRIFRSRLLDFFKMHPEGDEVPEEQLPEPFNNYLQQKQQRNMPKANASSESIDTSNGALNSQQPAIVSHLSKSFRRQFSKKTLSKEINRPCRMKSEFSFQPSLLSAQEPSPNKNSFCEETSSSALSPAKLSEVPNDENCSELNTSSACVSLLHSPVSQDKKIDDANVGVLSSSEFARTQTTPAKQVLTPARLMTMTPSVDPPKRCYMSPDNDSASSPNKLVRRPPRCLKFDTPVKDENVAKEVNDIASASDEDDLLDILPKNLLQSIREKEKKIKEEQDPAISQAKRRRQMIASLPKLFNTIHFLYQSLNRSVITKEELMNKIVANQYDIFDRSEVEDQLRLLLEIVPEWISEKTASSGDLLISINKISRPESIRSRLEEAK